MAVVIIDRQHCKGCGLCVAFCLKQNLAASAELNEVGYAPAEILCQEDCTGCKMCVAMCPDVCIEIYGEEQPEEVASDE